MQTWCANPPPPPLNVELPSGHVIIVLYRVLLVSHNEYFISFSIYLKIGLHMYIQYRPCHEGAPGRVAQSVTCLATDASPTADPGVASSIPARSHTFVEIDHEIISTAILLPSAESFKKGCCQLQAKVCARSTG